MFLDLIKKLSLKNIVKHNLAKTQAPTPKKIVTVGLLIDGTKFFDIEPLMAEFNKYGIEDKYIRALVLTKNKSAENTSNIIYIRSKDIGMSGEITDNNIKIFEDYRFDMLVNYYDSNQINLTYLSSLSKADFRVGFRLDNKLVNHFMIDSPIFDYKLFVEELFKYLNVLNKI